MNYSDANSSAYSDHQKAWELLPWYVNGSLEADEWASVSQHLASCTACTQEVTSLDHLGELLRGSEDLALSPDESFAALEARLDAADTGRSDVAGVPGFVSRLAGLAGDFARAPVLARRVLVAQAVLVLILIGALGWQAGQSFEPVYRTLSDPSLTNPDIQRADLLVVFHDNTLAVEIQTLLATVGADIVGGPSPRGVYQLRLREASGSHIALTRLRASATVLLAEAYPAEQRE